MTSKGDGVQSIAHFETGDTCYVAVMYGPSERAVVVQAKVTPLLLGWMVGNLAIRGLEPDNVFALRATSDGEGFTAAKYAVAMTPAGAVLRFIELTRALGFA